MYKKVNICDICKERVSTTKCSVCGRDICKECGNVLNISGRGYSIISYSTNIPSWNLNKGELILCNHCINEIKEGIHQVTDKSSLLIDIIKLIKNYIKLEKI